MFLLILEREEWRGGERKRNIKREGGRTELAQVKDYKMQPEEKGLCVKHFFTYT